MSVQVIQDGVDMQDRNMRDGGPVSGPCATSECLRVVDGCCLPFSTEVAVTVPSYESLVVEARFNPNCNFEDTALSGKCHVIFGASSRAECICARAFYRTSIESLSIPDSVVELGDGCFSGCRSLRRVLFGASSKLARICAEAFRETTIESLAIPDSVVELGERCFYGCKSLRSVTFGASSKLERV